MDWVSGLWFSGFLNSVEIGTVNHDVYVLGISHRGRLGPIHLQHYGGAADQFVGDFPAASGAAILSMNPPFSAVLCRNFSNVSTRSFEH